MKARLAIWCSWDDFQAYVDEREPKMLRAFTSLEVNSAGQYDLKHIKSATSETPYACIISTMWLVCP